MAASDPGVFIVVRWILDSGATMHMIGTLHILVNVQDYTGFVTFGTNMAMKAMKKEECMGLKNVILYTSV